MLNFHQTSDLVFVKLYCAFFLCLLVIFGLIFRLKEEKEKERAEVEEKSREQIEAVQRAKEQLLLENEIKLNQEKIKKEKMLKKRQKTER